MQFNRDYLERYWRTVRQVPPAQIAARLRLRGLRALEIRFPWLATSKPRPIDEVPRWPKGFVALGSMYPHGDADEIVEGYLTLLGERRSIAEVARWNEASVPRLWNFTLQYFEWAWALAAHHENVAMADAFERLWTTWERETVFPAGDAWAPYPVSLRLWVMCSIDATMVAGRRYAAAFRSSIDVHARFLARRLELDIGGNHLIKNLKALIGAGVFLGDAEMIARASALLTQQLQVQILADGGHYERSPSYHCQVLGDFLDVQNLLNEAGHARVVGLEEAIESMRRWLGSVITPWGELPMFNDGAAVALEEVLALCPVQNTARLRLLRESGYVVVVPDSRSFCVIDVGDPCPRELPGHAHADCLSFELWIDKMRWICDTGTSTYEAGHRRDYERSTAAHNTVMIDGVDQTEVWGAFRAGRRAHGLLLKAVACETTIDIEATHDGYHHLDGSPSHRRHFSFIPGALHIVDEVRGTGHHDILSVLVANTNIAGVAIDSSERVTKSTVEMARDFGLLEPAIRRVIEQRGITLPVTMSWDLTWT